MSNERDWPEWKDRLRKLAVVAECDFSVDRESLEMAYAELLSIALKLDMARAEPAAVCAPAEVVEAVRTWQCDEKCWAAEMHAALRTATLRPEAEVRADERERCVAVCERLASDATYRAEFLRAAQAIRAMGDDDE